ncbi:MAG: HAMP domain-containing protein, partial [Sphingomonadales bacterium]|nr:HAMP domain-containing protein [Sphingomonadales bacterium]
LQNGGQQWLVARVMVPPGEREFVATLIAQTLLLYAVLVGAIALILRRITRPLAALTERLERFAETRSPDGQLDPQGPDDMRRLIVAHNAMEARIAALLDEKDVMLGAIGHDLKTPLAALRVRIESVEDDTERGRMAATIEDIVRSLDDILSLARVGRPSDPLEQTELSALVASVVEEYEDMDEPVELADMQRIVLPVRSTWLRRGLRNLIDNALRYGQRARVSLVRESRQAVIWIEDDGPGIAEGDIERMLEPFARGEPSRNSATGGAGLGLTLARAIADQHGGSLTLANRRAPDGKVIGLVATLSLPLHQPI